MDSNSEHQYSNNRYIVDERTARLQSDLVQVIVILPNVNLAKHLAKSRYFKNWDEIKAEGSDIHSGDVVNHVFRDVDLGQWQDHQQLEHVRHGPDRLGRRP